MTVYSHDPLRVGCGRGADARAAADGRGARHPHRRRRARLREPVAGADPHAASARLETRQSAGCCAPVACSSATTSTRLPWRLTIRSRPAPGTASTASTRATPPRAPPASSARSTGGAGVYQVPVHAELSCRGLRRPELPADRGDPVLGVQPAERAQGLRDLAGPESWAATGKGWADAWKGIQGVTGTHGTQVIVEADRGSNKPDTLTQWHYFVVMNAHGHRVAVDAFLGEVDADVGRYVGRLGAKSYSYTSERVTAKPVRLNPPAFSSPGGSGCAWPAANAAPRRAPTRETRRRRRSARRTRAGPARCRA